MSTIKNDLIELRKLKTERARLSRAKADAETAFKSFQARTLERMEAEEIDSLKSGGTLFTRVEKVKGVIEDRRAFVQWCLDNDDDLIEWRERGELLNQLVRTCLDNGEPLPPGVNFRHDDYISQRTS